MDNQEGLFPEMLPADESSEAEPDKTVTVELSDEDAQSLISEIVRSGLVSWSDVAQQVLQALQPPQTATHVVRLPGIRNAYATGKRWPPARAWMYAQYGHCTCKSHVMGMTHDHVLPRDLLSDWADRLDNLRFLCYRCNQSRHWDKGGRLPLSTGAAYVYLLLKHRPRTWRELEKLGKDIGLTQSSQRAEETWALALHLNRHSDYPIDSVHETISDEYLERLQVYYEATNGYFAALANELPTRFADRVERWKALQLLVSTRNTKVGARHNAAIALELGDNKDILNLIQKDSLSDADRRQVLEACGLFSNTDIEQILRDHKVALFHLLAEDGRKALLEEINAAIAELKTRHGIGGEKEQQSDGTTENRCSPAQEQTTMF